MDEYRKMFFQNDADFQSNAGFALEYGAHLEQQLLKRVYPDLIAADILYIDSTMPTWAPSTVFRGVTAQGKLALVTTETTDIQNVSTQFATSLHKYNQFALGWTLTQQQIMESRQTGVDIQNAQAEAAFDIAKQGRNTLYLLGHEDVVLENGLNQRGLYNFDGIKVFTAASGVNALIKAQNMQGITDLFATAYNAILESTNQRFPPNVCVMPTQMYNALQQNYGSFGSSVSSGITFMDRLKTAFPGIKEWRSDVYINKVAGNGKGRIVMFNNNPSYIKGHEPMPMTFGSVFAEDGGRRFRSIGDLRSGGLEVRSTDIIAYIDGADDFPEIKLSGFSLTNQAAPAAAPAEATAGQTVSEAVDADISASSI